MKRAALLLLIIATGGMALIPLAFIWLLGPAVEEMAFRRKPCARDCLSPCCHYGCENARGHRW